MKKLLNQPFFILILLLKTTNTFSQATVLIEKVPSPTIKINTEASDGATEADYQVTFMNVPLADDDAEFNWFSNFRDATTDDAVAGGKTLQLKRTDVDVIDNGNGTYNKTFIFTKLDLFGPSLVNDQNVIYSGTGFPGSIESNIANLTVEPAPAIQIDIDTVDIVSTVERGSEFTVNFNYSSTVDITSLRINFWLVTFDPYSDIFVGSSAFIEDLVNTNGVSTAASATIVFPKATEIINGAGTTWMLNSPITADNGAMSNLYQYRFRLDDESGTTGQNFINDSPQKAFNFIDIQEVTNDADTDGVNTFAIDGTDLDICPNTPAGEIGTIDTDPSSPTYGCSTNEQNTLSVSDFNDASINGLFGPNPAIDTIEISSNIITKTYKVVSLSGATIKEVTAKGSLDISDLTKGIYFLVTDTGIAKFVKQ